MGAKDPLACVPVNTMTPAPRIGMMSLIWLCSTCNMWRDAVRHGFSCFVLIIETPRSHRQLSTRQQTWSWWLHNCIGRIHVVYVESSGLLKHGCFRTISTRSCIPCTLTMMGSSNRTIRRVIKPMLHRIDGHFRRMAWISRSLAWMSIYGT